MATTTTPIAAATADKAPVCSEINEKVAEITSSASCTAAFNTGHAPAAKSTNACIAAPASGLTSLIAAGILSNTCFATGIMFFKTIVAEEITLLTSCGILALSSAKPVIRFSQAALVIAILPLIVLSASAAVVPVIFIPSCTKWIASITSA